MHCALLDASNINLVYIYYFIYYVQKVHPALVNGQDLARFEVVFSHAHVEVRLNIVG